MKKKLSVKGRLGTKARPPIAGNKPDMRGVKCEADYRALFANMLNGFAYHKVIFDESGRPVDYVFLEVNSAFERLTGLKRKALIGKRVTEALPGIEKDPAGWIEKYGRLSLEGGEIRFEQYAENLGKWYDVSAYSPEKGYFVAVFDDITDRKQAEKMLKKSHEELEKRVQERTAELKDRTDLLEAFFEHTITPMAVLDRDFNFIIVNTAYAMAGSRDVSDYPGKNHFDLYPSDAKDTFDEVVRSKNPYIAFARPFEYADHPEWGVTYWDWSLVPVLDEAQEVKYLVFTLRDVTEQKKAEEQLRQSQKMEALGQLAGGIAHDFNNRLAAIMNFGHLAIMKLSKDSPARGHVEQILKTTEHAAALAHSLLSLGRGEVVSPMPVNLKAAVEGIKELLERTLGEGVKLSTEIEDVMVSAERGQLENVIINLAANARDAMPSGGRLTIEAYRVTFDEDFVKTHGFGTPGQYACLTVSDTGTGMDEKTLQRIFEPFFTTKPAGKGTGLGLAMVYGIIKKYGGFIKCYSEPGSGTTFRIYLPLAEAPADVISKPEPPIGGLGETILLAEDDAEVRSGTKALLEAFGYKVLEASDGEESVELFRRLSGKISLVILDVIMPGLNGVDAYERMRLLKPELKALFLSGYSAGHLSGDALSAGAAYFNKPVMPAEFLRKIKEMLGG